MAVRGERSKKDLSFQLRGRGARFFSRSLGSREKSAGFSLLELIITIAILTILASVGSAYYVGFYRRNQLDLEVKETAAVLRDVRNRAVSQEQASDWGIRFSNQVANPDYYQIFYGSSYVAGTIVSTHYYSMFLQLNDPGSGSNKDVIFTQLTGLPNASTTVKLSLANNVAVSSTVTINTNGQVQY